MPSDDTEFREDVLQVVKRHDPDASDLRALADDIESLADRYDMAEETL